MPSLPPQSPRVVPLHPSRGNRPGAECRGGDASFPVAAGILFGLGLGGFFDGIVLHQILQWHHMLTSAGYPADSVRNLRINMLWDGIFQAGTCVFIAAGLVVLWRAARRRHVWWSTRLLAGTMLIGFGAVQRHRGRHRPSYPAAAPRQRDGGARAVARLGPRLSRLGRADADRRLGALPRRPGPQRRPRAGCGGRRGAARRLAQTLIGTGARRPEGASSRPRRAARSSAAARSAARARPPTARERRLLHRRRDAPGALGQGAALRRQVDVLGAPVRVLRTRSTQPRSTMRSSVTAMFGGEMSSAWPSCFWLTSRLRRPASGS